MKNILFILGVIGISFTSKAQIFCTTAAGSGPTNYTTVSFTDSVFYYCTPISGAELTAMPPSGIPNWTFTWQEFDLATNSWIALSVTTNAASSTITGLSPGGYRVTVTDATSAIVGCYRAWIVEVLSPTTVDVDPIPPGCGAVALHGDIDWGSATPYYEPPAEPLIISATTQITVCFEATHTYVSDLGFYLVSPSFCGNSTVTLCPNPGSIGQGPTCNSGDNIGSGQDLCFTTLPSPNLDVCNPAPSTLQGTYDSYGAANIPINWAPIYGCDASQPGWSVQIYDCIGADVGVLQHTTITFTGTTLCGDTVTVSYDSGPISSAINDNSCSPGTASIYTVPVNPAIAVTYDTNFIWTASPNITIPNNTTSLDPIVNPGPTVNTTFTLSVDTANGGACIPNVCGGNWQDSELYIYTPPIGAILSGPATICQGDAPVNLTADVPGGLWSGNGITNQVTGLFDPSPGSGAQLGNNVIVYSVNNPCPINSFITINVVSGSSTATITDPGIQCINGSPITLSANPSGGAWSGSGITDTALGTFDPTDSGVGTFTIDYVTSGGCPASGTIDIIVDTLPDATISAQQNLCLNDPPVTLQAATPGGTWSGTGITDSALGTFTPSIAGTFTITYTVGTPCSNSSTTSITVDPLPNVNASTNQSICPGDSVQITATGASTYQWNPATDLSSSTDDNPFASPSSPTTYVVVGTDGNGCMDTADVTVNIFTPVPISFAGGTQVCEGDSLPLTAMNVTNVNWTPAATVSSPTSASTYVTPTTTTPYTVTGDDINGCATSGTTTITVNTIDADFSATPESGVAPLVVDFTNTSTNGIVYFWDFGDGDGDTTTNLSGTQTTYETEGIYTVTLTAMSSAGCTDVATVSITVIPDCVFTVPNVFSPNGDNVNDLLEIICARSLSTMNMKIFDRWGRQVAELTDPNQAWNGEGQSEGTFYYVVIAEGFNNTVYNESGFITIIR